MNINNEIFKKTITENGLETVAKYSHIANNDYTGKSHVDRHEAWNRRRKMVRKGWQHKDPTYASSYFSVPALVYRYIKACIKAPNNLLRIQEWDVDAGYNLALYAKFSKPIGEGYLLYGDPDKSLPMSGICVVLEYPANPQWPFSIKTAYPVFTNEEQRNAMLAVKAFQKELSSTDNKPMYSMCLA